MKINIENSSQILEKYQYLLLKTVNQFPSFDKEEDLNEAREVLIDAIKTYDENKSGFGGYLKYKLYYHFLDKSKKQKPDSLNDLDASGDELVDSLAANVNIEKDLLKKEEYKKLYQAINLLDENDKKILYMIYYQGKSHKDIGKALNFAPKTIRNANYKIIKKLRKELGK
ncbi:MAG: sigma-70 family RNA polymerase sigma factor [Peptoniphilaceae bacterium]|nr:sigma-70 family RNA polymerase sigma factor [Peptoniphilaceae bacterium]